MISSRKLEDLHPHVAKMCQAHIDACAAEGIDLLITCTYRDKEAQDALYAQGRTTPGHIVTKARGGQSFHNYRLAYDFVPLINGKPSWDATSPTGQALWEKIGELAEAQGLQWAGRWVGSLHEEAHCQWSNGLTLAQLEKGSYPPATV